MSTLVCFPTRSNAVKRKGIAEPADRLAHLHPLTGVHGNAPGLQVGVGGLATVAERDDHLAAALFERQLWGGFRQGSRAVDGPDDGAMGVPVRTTTAVGVPMGSVYRRMDHDRLAPRHLGRGAGASVMALAPAAAKGPPPSAPASARHARPIADLVNMRRS